MPVYSPQTRQCGSAVRGGAQLLHSAPECSRQQPRAASQAAGVARMVRNRLHSNVEFAVASARAQSQPVSTAYVRICNQVNTYVHIKHKQGANHVACTNTCRGGAHVLRACRLSKRVHNITVGSISIKLPGKQVALSNAAADASIRRVTSYLPKGPQAPEHSTVQCTCNTDRNGQDRRMDMGFFDCSHGHGVETHTPTPQSHVCVHKTHTGPCLPACLGPNPAQCNSSSNLPGCGAVQPDRSLGAARPWQDTHPVTTSSEAGHTPCHHQH